MLNCLSDFSDAVRITITQDSLVSVRTDWRNPNQGHARESQALVDLNNPQTNLAARAARLFFDHFGLPFGAQIEIQKSIPLGAGLGGGSGNAAVVLKHLARAFAGQLDISKQVLLELATALGSDLPFMLEGGLGVVTGIGEEILSFPEHPLRQEPLWLILPAFGIDTAPIFAELRKEDTSGFAQDLLLSEFADRLNLHQSTREDILTLVENDLYPRAALIKPEIRPLFNQLKNIPSMVASMSGSGSTLFALSRSPIQVDAELDRVTEMLRQCFVSDRVDVIQTFII
jgi:4-diphosphocytidyl-2-C-methyl-D-erythritol kinase